MLGGEKGAIWNLIPLAALCCASSFHTAAPLYNQSNLSSIHHHLLCPTFKSSGILPVLTSTRQLHPLATNDGHIIFARPPILPVSQPW